MTIGVPMSGNTYHQNHLSLHLGQEAHQEKQGAAAEHPGWPLKRKITETVCFETMTKERIFDLIFGKGKGKILLKE